MIAFWFIVFLNDYLLAIINKSTILMDLMYLFLHSYYNQMVWRFSAINKQHAKKDIGCYFCFDLVYTLSSTFMLNCLIVFFYLHVLH